MYDFSLRRLIVIGIVWLGVAGVSGCGSSGDGTRPSAADTVVVDGSSTVYRISQAAQLGFQKAQGDKYKVLVGRKGTGGGFSRYLQGELDVIDASRPAKPEEEKQAIEKGLEWDRFLVAYDGVTVVVNPKNTFVSKLTVDQLKRLFEPNSQVRTWKDLDPAWPAREIILYTPDNDSGTYEFFTEAIIGERAQRKDVQGSPDDNVLVSGVAGDEDGLGYFGYAYYASRKEQLRAVPIQAGPEAEAVMPGLETILNAEYQPLSRPLYLYVSKKSLQRDSVRAFLGYYLEHIEELATKAGYVPPREEDRAANKATFESSLAPAQAATTASATP